MSWSEVFIKRPVFAWMLMASLILFGVISLKNIGISQMPDINFPIVNIGLHLDNAAPEMMETNVVDVIEDAVMGIEGLSRVTSSISQGTANITCEFNMQQNINVALQEVEDRLQENSSLLPTNLDPPVVTKTNPEDQPILWVMLSAESSIPTYQQMIYARNTIKDQLSTISGVGDITFAGYVEPNLRVWVDQKKLHHYQLTATDLWTTIQNEQIEQPAGRIETAVNEVNIRILGETKTAEDFGKIRISTRNSSPNYHPIMLKDVAKIEEGISDLRQISRYNGKPTIGLGIIKQHGANAVEVAHSIKKKIKEIQTSLLPGYRLNVELDSTQFIEESIHELELTLILSVILTSIVCFLFLGTWSSTFNVILSIPTSIIGAFSILYFFGFTLNTFTLLGLSLAIGIVVDDAIMMLENIVRHFEMGKNKVRAAIDGSNEITFAAIATTLAIAAIFIPVIFMQGVLGKFFYQYGITVTAAVFLSLLEAITLIPMRCSQFMYTEVNHGNFLFRSINHALSVLSVQYKRSLKWVLRFKWMFIVFSLICFLTSMGLVLHLNTELIPSQDQSLFLLSIRTPIGSSIQVTDNVYKKAEDFLKNQDEIKSLYSTIGNYQNANVVNVGVIYVILKEQKLRKLSQREVMDKVKIQLQKILPESEIATQDLSLTGLSATRGFPVEFTLEGPKWEKLLNFSEQIISLLKKMNLLEDINTDFQDGISEIDVIPDRVKSAEHGVSILSIGNEIGYLIGGQKFNSNTQYPKEGHRYNIRIRSEPQQRESEESIRQLKIPNNRGLTGDLILLEQVAQLKKIKSPQLITRINRNRAIPVYANIAQGQSQATVLKSIEKIAQSVLPKDQGYSLKFSGNANAFYDAYHGLIFALLFGVVIAYMILASQFNSFIHPVAVLTALPFSLTGAFLALFLTHQSLNLYSMIGLILLMGIVKKNSILLVDFTNQQRTQGLSVTDSLLEASSVRLRPILMTSIATIAGAAPEAFNFGPGSETRIPMAICLIGGVLISTLFTLYIVPCVYSVLSYFERPETKEMVS